MELEVINQVFPQEGRVKSSPAARKVIEALETNVGYLMAHLQTRTYIQFVDGIAFPINKPSIKGNYCRIMIAGEHTYTLWVARVEVGGNSLRVTTLAKARNLGIETLREVFEEEMGFALTRRATS
jgi:hypothetical protein